MSTDFTDHLSAQRLQAFLDGDLPPRDVARVEEHLAACVRCSEELASWSALFEDLEALPSLAPPDGFAERVIAGVRPAAPVVTVSGGHVAEEILQDYLDGALGGRKAARVEAHLAACGTCSAEAESWSALIARLEGLDRLAPTAGFGDRVMAGVPIAEPTPLAARVTALVRSLVGSPTGHPHTDRLQDFADGAVGGRRAARIRTHLEACPTCAGEAEVWSSLLARLGTLEHFRPRAGFADQVMAAVRVPHAATSPVLAQPPRLRAAGAWALATARRFVPRTKRAWAAISGVAVTPAVTVALMLYAVFSHPTLTPGALLAFVGWQLADLATMAWSGISAAALQSAQLFGLYSLFESLAGAPMAVAGAAVVYSLLSALALRVLYKNVFAHRATDRRYVSAS